MWKMETKEREKEREGAYSICQIEMSTCHSFDHVRVVHIEGTQKGTIYRVPQKGFSWVLRMEQHSSVIG